jgi:hypothetical protein
MTHAGVGAASTVAIGEVEKLLLPPAAATHAALSLSLQLKLKGLLSLDVAAADSAKATAVMRAANTRLRSLSS